MLMCGFSLTLQKTIVMLIYNQYPGIELISPVYFCNCGTHYEYPVKRTNEGAVMKIDLRFDPNQDEPVGILMYKVQREENTISGHQSSIDPIYSKAIESVSKMVRFLVIWKIKRSGEPKVDVMLVEHGNELILNEDKLAKLFDKVNSMPSTYFATGWLMYDNTISSVLREVVRRGSLESRITISTENNCPNVIRLMWIESER
jgi:hypothetical protein